MLLGPPIIRDLDLDRDPAQVAQLYQRHGYGAAVGNGIPLTGAAFRQMMRENDLRECLVAEVDGRVVALLGAFAVDGARAAPPGVLRGNHFLMEASARGGIIAGQLFQELFERLTRLGIGSIRVRVNPKNRSVVDLYVRAGFRSVGQDRPDADGFIGLVSHLPGVMAAVRAVTADHPEVGVHIPHLTLSNLRGGRGQGFEEGVTQSPDGRWWVRHRIQAKGLDGGVVMDGETGRVLWIGANGVDYTDGYTAHLARQAIPATPEPGPVSDPRTLGEFTLSLDGWGRLRVDHPAHLGPFLLDCFPDGEGHTVAYRCPPPHPVVTTARPDGWTTRDRDGLERTLTLADGVIEVDCRLPDASARDRLAVHPWCGLRSAEFAVSGVDGQTTSGPSRPGRWPPQLPAYEAAGDAQWSLPAKGATSTWTDHTAGLGVSVDWRDTGRLRAEGECRAQGNRLRYRYRLSARERIAVAAPARALPLDPRPLAPGSGQTAWRHLTGPGGAELVIDPAAGIVAWRARGLTVLERPAGGAGFGALASVPAAAWASLLADRSDVDRGPEWAGRDDRVRFLEPGQVADDADQATWTVAASEDLEELEFTLQSPGAHAGLEAAFTLKPPAGLASLQMADSAGHLIEVRCRDAVERPWGLWWGFTRRVLVPVGPGRVLDLAAVSAEHPEILVRSVTAGFLITMLSRVTPSGSIARWGARLVASGQPCPHQPTNQT
ncbi:MAG: GNAT family N-acetyltransferase [Propionibacteriaceae bacterium]|jgi:L-amino acid N-acyltransferase YncA|nr:GNAT family N-acetyltransferase [Propionibacteriaceae bacterium]